MEADSTTENNTKSSTNDNPLPFSVSPSNYKLYADLTDKSSERTLESQIVERLQSIGVLQNNVKCPSPKPDCKATCKTARVIDRVQWVCDACGKRQAVRTGSMFAKLQCSILQALQMILAWCEDVELEKAATYFGVKPRMATNIYDKLDEIAIKEQNKMKLGGENSVVLVEMYPDCMNRLSPDTTDQPHVHKIIMLADTNHIPTRYWIHVLRDYPKKIVNNNTLYNQALKQELEDIVAKVTGPNSTVVTGNNVPQVEGMSSIQQLLQHCDADMQHFLTSRIWRQAVSLCCASRDICRGQACSAAVQRYLHTALYRLQHNDGYYSHMLRLLADELTQNHPQHE